MNTGKTEKGRIKGEGPLQRNRFLRRKKEEKKNTQLRRGRYNLSR